MSIQTDMLYQPGQRIKHPEFGEGVIISSPAEGFLRVFFSVGERRVPLSSILPALDRSERIVQNVGSGEERIRRAWLSYKAHALPLLKTAASLTSAKIDLLPHQVVLTHRVATALPRRFLIADEVGLGKTIETALILRELASRGELQRALMVVPAGLVNNWHRELNEVFNLDFEVFGSEGDVTDRKSNAFMKHDRLIASIDTLKLKHRVNRLKEAPMWDLVVFDEGHHLTAYRSGGKVRKTENYKLAEVLKDHTRDLLILSATPHQGDHFRFWMIVQLLDPTLFASPQDMVENRHRLNAIVFRRTKADACRSDGSPLFARRWVHTESFVMSDLERQFYIELNNYLVDGFALAKRYGNKGQALGFVMAIFQKIAASSFAAVHRTLRRRLIALTVQEGLMRDDTLDIERRDSAYKEARELIRGEFGLSDDRIGAAEAEHILTDMKRKLVKKMDEEELALASSEYAAEYISSRAEDAAINCVELALPEERQRIRDLLARFPQDTETKVKKLLAALGTLWKQNPSERVVIFATYLGTVEMIAKGIDNTYPGQGVVVLKGGDHGAKLAAEKRFKSERGPKVMVCTAAGREGINLQHARILFNFDLPWNPMDLEQRIGRIHRYGQQHTAQVYNLVLSDTIEGKIFLMLDEKLTEICKALGKVDEQGKVAEDLRSQILGQLAERLNYERLYSDALNDPELKRTRLELDAAMSNAAEARSAVSELFQDLDRFNLDDYQAVSDVQDDMSQIVHFLQMAVQQDGGDTARLDESTIRVKQNSGVEPILLTTDRDRSVESDDLQLLGLDHPMLAEYMDRFRNVPPDQLGIRARGDNGKKGVLSMWRVETRGGKGEAKTELLAIAVDSEGNRVPQWERDVDHMFSLPPVMASHQSEEHILRDIVEPMLQRELQHRGILREDHGYDARLIGWVEVV